MALITSDSSLHMMQNGPDHLAQVGWRAGAGFDDSGWGPAVKATAAGLGQGELTPR